VGAMRRLVASHPAGFRAAIGLVVAAIALIPIAWQLCVNWADVGVYLARVNAGGLLAAELLAVVDLGVLVSAWLLVAHWLGLRVAISQHLKAFFVSNFAKRVPGLVWYVASRAYVYRTVSGGTWRATTATLLENTLLFLAGLLLALILWPSQLGLQLSWMPVSLLLSVSVAVILSVYPAAVLRLARLLRFGKGADVRESDLAGLPATRVLSLLVLYALVWLIGGLSLHCFIGAFHPWPSLAALPFTISVSIAYSLTGFIAFFVPAGLGVKELAGAYLLAPVMPLRLNLLLAEGFWIVLSYCLERRLARGLVECTRDDSSAMRKLP
jgi:hypothetical protein